MVYVLRAEACNTDTTPTQPHRNSNTHRTKNNTTNVVIQQNSRKLLMMDILMSDTCWAHNKWNKIASDIKLVFYSSTITMMHGPINIRINFIVKTDRIVISEHGKTEKSVPPFFFTSPTILCRYWNVGSTHTGCAYGCGISVTGLHCARLPSHLFLSLHLSFLRAFI